MGYKKLIVSGRTVETYNYEKDLPKQRKQRKTRNNTGFKHSYTRRTDNVRRLRKSFVRLVRANLARTECPVFLTLTMASILRIDVAYECYSRFIRRMRAEYGQDWSYIAVPEFQKRGAVHFHVLAWGLPPTLSHDERVSRAVQRLWSFGTCDLIETDGNIKIAGYLAKYMQKALHDKRLLSQKSYVCSRNILRAVSYNLGTVFDFKDELFGKMTSSYKKEFLTQWLGSCTYEVFDLEPLDTLENESNI